MKITDLAVRYRTTVLVLTLLLIVGGIVSYVTIPKEAQPSIEIPNIVVTTVYPGASPDDVESIVTQPIEREVQNINGIDVIESTSNEGVSTVIIEFTPNVAMDDAYQKVRDKVDIAKTDLPDDVEEPIVSEIDLSELPIMTINLGADYSLARLKEVAEDLQDEIEGIPSVLEVDLIGGLEREVQVDVNLNKLQGYNLSFNSLTQTIQQENSNIPGGSIDVERLKYSIRATGEFTDPSQIENLIVKVPEERPGGPSGSPVYLRDVADVTFGFKDPQSYSRLQVYKQEQPDGSLTAVPPAELRTLNVISLNVKKRSGENILGTVDRVNQVLQESSLPSGTQVVVTGDRSENVNTLVKDLENNIISGLIFVVAVLLFFLGVRNALLVGIAIPLSMFTSFIVLQGLGYTLNFIMLFSLIIALGMLVDNAVVVVENIYRFREEGYSRFEAARLGTAEVGGAVTAATATTVAAFVPMLFWPGIIGEFMGFLPLTLIVTLSCSLFVALVINPVMTAFFMKVKTLVDEDIDVNVWKRRVGLTAVALAALVIGLANPITLAVLFVGGVLVYFLHRFLLRPIGDRFISTGLPRLMDSYRNFLRWTLYRQYENRSHYLRNMIGLGSLALGGVLGVAGGAVYAGLGMTAATVLLAPAAIFGAIGMVAVCVHSLEAIFRGRGISVAVGIGLAIVLGTIIFLVSWVGRPLPTDAIIAMLGLPALVVVVGLLGFLRTARGPLLLTDNRALVMNTSLGALFAILSLYQIAPTGVEFFPPSDPTLIQVNLEAPLGTNLEASNAIADTAHARVQRLLEEYPAARTNVENIVVNVGVGGDILFGGGSRQPESSQITLNMVDYADRAEPSSRTLDRLRQQLQGIPGTTINIEQDSPGPPTGAPVNIEISGEQFETIVGISDQIKRRLREAAESGEIPGLVDIRDNLNTGRPEVKVRIDRDRAARFGLNTATIAQTIRTAMTGTEASQYRDGEEEYDITVRLARTDRQSLESLRNLTIPHEGEQIPLVSVADFEVGSGFGAITRKDLNRVVTVQGSTAPGYSGPEVLNEVQEHLSDYRQELPPGYSLEYTGENEEQQESFDFLTTALIIGIGLIFMILIAEFNSISAPFIIILAVGLSLIGVLLGLIVTRTPFGLFTFIGIISLAGIVVNNAIVLVDYVMQLRARGLSKLDAVIEGGAVRLRPVLLTALTTILGLIPLTFGINVDFVGLLVDFEPAFQLGSENTQFWGPMGTAIISGLTFATFLTLVIVPIMYSLFDSTASHTIALFGGNKNNGAITFEDEKMFVSLSGNGDTQPVAPEASPSDDTP
jgi:multidrug efflux pump subunit AcrB